MADDIIDKLVNLLKDNWTISNTNNRLPFIDNINKLKRASGDSVLLYNIAETPSDNASGAISKQKTKVVAIDIRTFRNYDLCLLFKEEVERIINSNQKDVFSDQLYDINDITNIQDLSDTTRGLFRYKVTVQVEQFNILV